MLCSTPTLSHIRSYLFTPIDPAVSMQLMIPGLHNSQAQRLLSPCIQQPIPVCWEDDEDEEDDEDFLDDDEDLDLDDEDDEDFFEDEDEDLDDEEDDFDDE